MLARRILACIAAIVPAVVLALAPSLAAGAEPQTTISATAGEQFSGQVADIHSLVCPPSDLRHEEATIVWGDDPSTAGVVSTDKEGTGLSVSGTHTYLEAGTYEGSVKLRYECNQTPFSATAAFTAQVKAPTQEPPPVEPAPPAPPSAPTTPAPPTPPPTPPPVARAAFTLLSVTPGRAVLDASASAPTGTSVARYSWNVSGDAQPDAVCQGGEPQLTVVTRGALDTTVQLTAVDAQGLTTTTQQALDIPAPTAASKSAHTAALRAHASASLGRRVIGTSVSPAFTVLAECSGETRASVPPLALKGQATVGARLNVGGAPPAECTQDVEYGAADVMGCLEKIKEPSELPGGITLALATLLCGAHDEEFCVKPLQAVANAGASLLGDALGEAASARGAASATQQRAAGAVTAALSSMGFPSYYSWDPVRIDGLDVDPRSGQPILVIPSASVVVSADASIYLHGIQISPVHTVALYLPASGGQLGEISLPHKIPIIGSLPFSGRIAVALRRAGAVLPNGDTCAFDCAAISVEADLPGIFSDGEGDGNGLKAGGVITADDQEGLELDSLEVSIGHAEIAGIGVDNVDFRYRRSDDSLRGQATLDLLASGEITAAFAFVHGSFQEGRVAWDAGDGPGIDLGGPFPIFLTRLGGGVSLNPTTLNAEGAIAGGGDALGCSLFGISGKLTIQFAPFDLQANATGELLCQEVAEEYFHVDEAGDIGLGGKVHLEIYVLSFSGGVAFEISQGHFQFDGNAQVCVHVFGEHCLGAEVVISDRGVGVCADLEFTHAGGGIVFPDSYELMLDSCDIAQFRSLPMPANLSTLNGGAGADLRGGPAVAFESQALPSFTVPRGERVAAIGVAGEGGAPDVTLRGPDGRTVSTPADGYLKNHDEVVVADGQKSMETYFLINHPAPGRWRIVSNPGSVPVSGVHQAASLPSPDLHATVSRSGRDSELLRYSLRSIPGQQVTFVDAHKGQGFRVLGHARGSHGTLRFTPSSALGHTHQVVAWVTENGHPREDVTLARYAAPPPPRLAAPRGLTARRRGETVAVRWHAVAGARGYKLTVRLSNGVLEHYAVGAPTHGAASVRLSTPTYLGLRVSVAAQAPGKTHRAGHAATVKLRPGPRPRGVAVKPIGA